jgi:DNA-binding MarR family transcriptional regulator
MTSSKRAKRSTAKPVDKTRELELDILPSLLGVNIRRAQIALWRDFNRNVAEGDVRPGIFSALVLASANPGIAQIEIANQLGIDKASVVSLIDRMEHAGWVRRVRSSEDRRRQEISLTAGGTRALKSLRKEMIEHERKFVDRFTGQELKTLISLLRRLHDAD